MKQHKRGKYLSCSLILAVILCTAALLSGCDTAVTTGSISKNLKIEIVNNQEDTENYVLDFQTPQIHGIENEDTLNQTIQEDIDGYIEEVKNCSLDASADNALNAKCSLYIRTLQYVNKSGGYASLLLDCSNYTGGAHGMNWYQAYNINLKDGTLLTADQLFEDPQKGTAQLRQIVLDKIAEAPEDYFPSANEYVDGLETFQFFLTEGKLTLWFNPYELAPYAAGLITIQVPFEELDGFRLS